MKKKYTPTPEQAAATAQRRENFKNLCKKIAALTESERHALAARTLARKMDGSLFSPTNQMLIASQYDSATICGGFAQWRAAGRKVKKDEHGISIWIPTANKKADEPKDEAGTAENDVNFFMGYVYDISQTEELTTA